MVEVRVEGRSGIAGGPDDESIDDDTAEAVAGSDVEAEAGNGAPPVSAADNVNHFALWLAKGGITNLHLSVLLCLSPTASAATRQTWCTRVLLTPLAHKTCCVRFI